jgi:hypothetical protein
MREQRNKVQSFRELSDRRSGRGTVIGGFVIFSPFADRDVACDNEDMRRRRLLNLLIALSVAAGLLSMPFAPPVHAKSGPPVVTSSDEMEAMAEDMPCCPHEQKSKACEDCPLLGICLAKSTQINPAASAILLDRTFIHAVLLGADDVIADGLERPPPDHPPRILV